MEACSDTAKLPNTILEWVDHINKNEDIYEERESENFLSITKVAYIVDDRTDRYMRSCARGCPLMSLLNFMTFQEQIIDRSFQVQLPPELQRLALRQLGKPTGKGRSSGDRNKDEDAWKRNKNRRERNGKRRQRFADDISEEEITPVKNESQNPKLILKDDKTYGGLIAGALRRGDIDQPMWNSKPKA